MNEILSKNNKTKVLLKWWLISFAAAMILYFFTLAPDLVWQDQGDYQLQVAKMSLNRPGDVVRVHPLFMVVSHFVGRVLPISYAYAANLVSAVFGAVTVANVFVIVYLLTVAAFPAFLSAAVLAFSHSHWFLSVQAQTYSMANSAFTTGLILYLLYKNSNNKRLLYLMGLIFGIGISAHMMSQVGFAVVVFFIVVDVFKKKLNVKDLSILLICWFFGAALLWLVIWIEYQRNGDFAATLLSAVYGKWGRAVFNLGKFSLLIKRSVLFFVLNFPTPLVLLGVWGFILSFKKLKEHGFGKILALMTLLYGVFALRYDVPNQNNFFIPFYILVSIYIGLGFSFISKYRKFLVAVTLILVFGILPAYPAISAFAEKKHVQLGTRRHIPYRDVYEYYLIPWQQNQTGPRRLVTETFEVLPRNSVLFLDSTVMPAFNYAQSVELLRSDIKIEKIYVQESAIDRRLGDYRWFTPCNTKRYYPSWVDDGYNLIEFPISDTENIFEIHPLDNN